MSSNQKEREEYEAFRVLKIAQHVTGFILALNISTMLMSFHFWFKTNDHLLLVISFIFSILCAVIFIMGYMRLEKGALKHLKIEKEELKKKQREL